eukprot:3941129-Rhodomonas_salina.5
MSIQSYHDHHHHGGGQDKLHCKLGGGWAVLFQTPLLSEGDTPTTGMATPGTMRSTTSSAVPKKWWPNPRLVLDMDAPAGAHGRQRREAVAGQRHRWALRGGVGEREARAGAAARRRRVRRTRHHPGHSCGQRRRVPGSAQVQAEEAFPRAAFRQHQVHRRVRS